MDAASALAVQSPTTKTSPVRWPTIKPDSRTGAEDLYARIVKAQGLDLTGVDLDAYYQDLTKLYKKLPAEVTELIRNGYPSPTVVDYIMEHSYRGDDVQGLSPEDWLARVEASRRFYIQLEPGVNERSLDDWALYLGLTPDNASSSGNSPRHPKKAKPASTPESSRSPQNSAPCPEKFVYEREQEAEILRKARQFSRVTQDLLVQLCLSRISTEVMSTVVARCAEGGVLNNCLPEELIYLVELIRRRLYHLESEWEAEHTRTEPSYDAKAEYLRRAMRDGLKIVQPSPIAQPAERIRFNLGQLDLLNSQYAGLTRELRDRSMKRLLLGDSAETVTRWLMEQGDRGALQHATYQELLRLMEYRRRFLFYGLGNSVGRFARSDDYKVHGDRHSPPDHVASEHSSELVVDIAALPDPRCQEFLRVLCNGGAVNASVLRFSRQLREGIDTGAAAVDVGGRAPLRARCCGRRQQGGSHSSYRRGKGDGMLLSLGKLPTHVLEEAIRLLVHGFKATVVARFILSHEDLGDFPRLAQNTVRQYLEYLATKVAEEVQPSRERTRLIHQVAKVIRKQRGCRRAALLTRRIAAQASGITGETMTVGDIESLASLKRKLAALFVIDPDQWRAVCLTSKEEIRNS